MSADSFHAKVEKEMNKMKMVCDWVDFLTCVGRAGDVLEMNVKDFGQYENGLSQGKRTRETRPHLDTLNVAEFRKGLMYYFVKDHMIPKKPSRRLIL